MHLPRIDQPDFFSAANGMAVRMEEAEAKRPEIPRAVTDRFLESRGWLRSVAGERDFSAASGALARILQSPRMGLFLFGSFGCGKTSLIKAMTAGSRRKTVFLSMSSDEDLRCLDERCYPNFNQEVLELSVVLDDLGAEPAISDYGIKRELAGEFIVRFHERGQGRLHITTNLGIEALVERYSQRVTSRIRDLCLPVEFIGGDKRKWGGAKFGSEEKFRSEAKFGSEEKFRSLDSNPLNLQTSKLPINLQASKHPNIQTSKLPPEGGAA